MKISKKILLLVFITLSAFIIILGLSVALVITNLEKKSYITTNQKQNIFNNFLKQNSNVALMSRQTNLTNHGSFESSKTESIRSDLSNRNVLMEKLVVKKDYNFSKVYTKKTKGPKINDCKAFSNDTNAATTPYETESWDFSDASFESYMNKYITKNVNGELINYSISRNIAKEKINETITYMGGEYAVKTKYPVTIVELHSNSFEQKSLDQSLQDQEITNPNDNDVNGNYDPIESLKVLYGPDIDIVGQKSINGQDVYIMRYSMNFDCNSEIYTIMPVQRNLNDKKNEVDMKKIYSQIYIGTQDYKILYQFYYLNNVNDDNLIYSEKFDTKNKNINLDEAKKYFEFDYDVPIKELIVPEYNPAQEKQKALNLLDSKDFVYIKPSNVTIKIVNGYVYNDYRNADYNYLNDRKFFPNTEYGNRLFESYNLNIDSTYVNSFGNYMLQDLSNNNTISISIFDIKSLQDYIDRTYKSRISQDENSLKITYKDITISNKLIKTAQVEEKILYEKLPSVMFEEREQSSTNDGYTTSTSFTMLLEIDNYVYSIYIYNNSTDNIDPQNYTYEFYKKGSNEFKQLYDVIKSNIESMYNL